MSTVSRSLGLLQTKVRVKEKRVRKRGSENPKLIASDANNQALVVHTAECMVQKDLNHSHSKYVVFNNRCCKNTGATTHSRTCRAEKMFKWEREKTSQNDKLFCEPFFSILVGRIIIPSTISTLCYTENTVLELLVFVTIRLNMLKNLRVYLTGEKALKHLYIFYQKKSTT